MSATGDTSWRRTITPAGLPFGAAVAALEVTPGGNVVLACTVCDYLSSINGLLVGLGARDGVERWRRTVDGDAAPGDVDAVRDLTLTPQGDLVAVGVTQWDDTGRDLTALRMRARTGRARGLGRLDPRGGAPR